MSLSDLKKKQTTKPKPKLSVEEFIDDAKAYAKGKSVIEAHAASSSHHRNFKNATFTLSPENINQLTELSEKTGIAKSRIIRLLIDDQFHTDLTVLTELDKKAE
jgi:hypothetical protein